MRSYMACPAASPASTATGRHRGRLGDEFGTDPETTCPRRSRWRRRQQRAGTQQQHASAATTRGILAEGSIGAFFDTPRALQSGPRTATVVLRFQRSGRRGDPAGPRDSVPQPRHGESRNDRRPRERGVLDRRRGDAADRRRPHDALGRQRLRRHAETAIAEPATTWYLAEGSTAGGFELFYLLQNPKAQRRRR